MTTYRLPKDIIADWEGVLDAGTLLPQEREVVWQLVQRFLPPLAARALEHCHALWLEDVSPQDGVAAFGRDALRDAAHRLHLPVPLPRNILTAYPLFGACTSARHLGRAGAGYVAARQVLCAWFSQVPRGATRSMYYTDVHMCRDALRLVARTFLPDKASQTSLPRQLLNAMDALGDGPARTGEDVKIERYRNILLEERWPAVPAKYQPEGTERNAGTRIVRDETAHLHISRPLRPCGRSRQAALERLEEKLEDVVVPTDGGAVYRPVGIPRGGPTEAADSDDIDHVRRVRPSALTPEDDEQMVRRAARIAPTTTLVAVTDFHRLPTARVVEALAALAEGEDADWAMAWLLLATGLSDRRLSMLRVSPILPDGEAPHLCPKAGSLRVRLLDGPAPAGDAANCVVSLVLPMATADALTAQGEWPLVDVRARLAKRLRSVFANSPGPAPTPARLAATAPLWIRPLAVDDVAAKALSGRFGVALAAPAAYRRFGTGELQALFEATTVALRTALLAQDPVGRGVEERVAALSFPPPRPAGLVGSARAKPASHFAPLFQAIDGAARSVEDAWTRQRGRGRIEVPTVLSALRLQCAYTYLTWLLATGARPVGPKSKAVDLGWGAWISDKASGQFLEARVVPVPAVLRHQLEALQETQAAVVRVLSVAGCRPTDHRPRERKFLPSFIRLSGRRGLWRVFEHVDFEAVLAEVLPEVEEPFARNATRHCVASTLRDIVPSSALHTMLGHVPGGRNLLSPVATAPLTPWQALLRPSEKLLREAGFRLLAFREVSYGR